MKLKAKAVKKVVQTISYLPHFLSWIIVTGILHDMLSGGGIVNELLLNFHIISQPIEFLCSSGLFLANRCICQMSGKKQDGMQLFIGSNYFDRPVTLRSCSYRRCRQMAKIKHVTLPGIKPTIIILLLMNVGNVLNAGFEVQYLLGNGLVQKVSQTIDIYVLKWGISQGDFAIGTAAGIFKSFVSIILIVIANQIAKRNGEEQLF